MTASFAGTLDLRQIAPSERHPLVLSRFEALQSGQLLELVIDHDPQPLNTQLKLRSDGLFSWAYLEKGPALWRVQIGKNAKAAPAAAGGCCSGGACCG
jgi:uncharacterized protein (DUF2249 family)